MVRTKCSPWDFLAIGLVLAAALLLFLLPWMLREDGRVLLVETPDGTATYELSVDRELTVTSNGVTLTVVIEDGEAWVKHSDCPDAICRSSGKISGSGETVLCAPAGVRLTVKGGGDGVDFVAG